MTRGGSLLLVGKCGIPPEPPILQCYVGWSSEPDSIVACSSPLAGVCDASNKLHSRNIAKHMLLITTIVHTHTVQ